MPRGSPGQAKSPEHKAALSASVKQYHEAGRRRLDRALDDMQRAVYESKSDVAQFEKILKQLLEAMTVLQKAESDSRALLLAEMADVRRSHAGEVAGLVAQLDQRGGSLRSVDQADLLHLERSGLISKQVASAEWQRRRSFTPSTAVPFSTNGEVSMVWDAGGHFAGVDASPPGRQYLDGNLAPVDLDAARRDIEGRREHLRRQLEQADEEMGEVERRIAAYDAHKAGDGERGDDATV